MHILAATGNDTFDTIIRKIKISEGYTCEICQPEPDHVDYCIGENPYGGVQAIVLITDDDYAKECPTSFDNDFFGSFTGSQSPILLNEPSWCDDCDDDDDKVYKIKVTNTFVREFIEAFNNSKLTIQPKDLLGLSLDQIFKINTDPYDFSIFVDGSEYTVKNFTQRRFLKKLHDNKFIGTETEAASTLRKQYNRLCKDFPLLKLKRFIVPHGDGYRLKHHSKE